MGAVLCGVQHSNVIQPKHNTTERGNSILMWGSILISRQLKQAVRQSESQKVRHVKEWVGTVPEEGLEHV